ncbi:MAG: tetratricopeptide repeat protein [Rhodospirillaceae bacterium]
MNRQYRRAAGKKTRAAAPALQTGDLFALAQHHHQVGEWGQAEQLYREILALDPEHGGSLHYLGILAYQVGRLDLAEAAIGQAAALCPDDAEIRNNLGTVLWRQGKLSEAAAQFERALMLKSDYAEAHNNFANTLKDLGRLADAVAHYAEALKLRSGYAEAHNNLGSALQSLGRLPEALAHYEQALKARANYPEAHNNAGNARLRQGRVADAVAHYERALQLRADYPEALNNLGSALLHLGRLSDATRCFERALALKPEFPGACNNLGGALQNQGRLAAAAAHFERALALDPAYEEAHRNLIYTQLYRPGVGLDEILTASRRWSAAHADRFKADWPLRLPATCGGRPRLGFVSGDFRSHVVGRLMIPVLEALSRAGHDIVCYSNSAIDDALTARFRAATALWRPISGRADEEVAAQIRADGIEILVDLSGYTADNRLLVFARKPAPLQITWLGYPATTGMTAMDYLLADAVQVPAAADRGFEEKIIRLPDGYHLYRPIAEAPEVGPPPAAANGFVTFGSFNGVQKLSEPAIASWSRILRRLPSSRLTLKAPGFTDPATRQRYLELFAAHGIGAERLTVLGRTSPSEHMAAMTATDIALDSFPYTGGATTVDTLWMGVPVITLAGETMAGRLSAGYLTAIGRSELIAGDDDAYVELAVALARDAGRLATLRSGLRPSMADSPLCDEARFVRTFEAACAAIRARLQAGEPPCSFEVKP